MGVILLYLPSNVYPPPPNSKYTQSSVNFYNTCTNTFALKLQHKSLLSHFDMLTGGSLWWHFFHYFLELFGMCPSTEVKRCRSVCIHIARLTTTWVPT